MTEKQRLEAEIDRLEREVCRLRDANATLQEVMRLELEAAHHMNKAFSLSNDAQRLMLGLSRVEVPNN